MSTTLLNCEKELSRQIGDFWEGTTTSAGAGGGTTIVDTALKAKANDWINHPEAFTMIESGTADEEERQITSLDNTTGTLTVLAHSAQIANTVTYRVHRLFSASDKRRALVVAARQCFPYLFQEVWDESFVSGNWLKNGSFEHWSTTTTPVSWTVTTSTATETTSSPYYKHGLASAKIDTLAGTVKQTITNWDDLKHLAGKSVTFSSQAWCNTASCLRLSIYDGTTRTYSDYHAGDSAWTQNNPRNDSFYVTAFIDYNPTAVEFTYHHEVAAGTSYVDDARVISDYRGRQYIGNLWLALNKPHAIYIESDYYSQEEDWIRVRDYKIDQNAYLYIPTVYLSDRRLRIRGLQYLDFLASGQASTSWSSTIAINQPQLDILVAQAALYLYTTASMPNYETGTRKAYQEATNYWAGELDRRVNKFRMFSPPTTIQWGMP